MNRKTGGQVAERTSAPRQLGFGRLMLVMAAFVIVGTPLVYLLWRVVNDLLTGQIVGTRLLLAVPALVVFIIVLNVLARTIRRWDAGIG
jgi:hypothetical protein